MKPFGMPTNLLNPSSSSRSPAGRAGGDLSPSLSPARRAALAAFQKTASIRFKSLALLNLSFIHRSVANEAGIKYNNERLEFLGDAILGAVTATLLYKELAERPEGELAKIKAVVVSEEILSALALQLQLDNLLILGKGEDNSGGRTKKAILADALEALIGAYYLDSGYKAAYGFVSRCIAPEIQRVLDQGQLRDYKSLLQELSQGRFKTCPSYRMIKRTGPDHERLFWMEAVVNQDIFGPGVGKNKKSAEQEAARMAWESLKGEG